MSISHYTPFSTSCLFDDYKNSIIGINTENDMNYFDHQYGHEKIMDTISEIGPSNGEIKETTKKKKTTKENNKMRKHRYAFHTRSKVDILDDGYRWRKYGQKAVKNNKYPRSYYRCTYGGCNVKKQVQRLTKDEEVVVTTYEGSHTHPVERSPDNFEHILKQMQIYVPP